MKIFTLLGMLISLSISMATALPNQKINLRGKIVTAGTNNPLEYATVSVFTPDSLLIDGTITDHEGIFELSLDRGRYLIKFEFLGFVTQFRSVIMKQELDMGNIQLIADQVSLDEVEVRAERSQMNLLLDKKVFNVGQDALSRGGSANEVLEQLPSITVSAEGEVSLRGNSGVNVLINGRPSTLADNNALASIPAESIEKVEVITNPSAKYEAAGTAGIINIILKKEQQQGYGGTISLNTGYPDDHRLNVNMNWRKKKFNAFANIGALYSNFYGDSESLTQSFLAGVSENLQQNLDQNRNDRGFSAYSGIDFFLNPTSTLTATYSLFDMVNTDFFGRVYQNLDDQKQLTRKWQQDLDYVEPGVYHQIDLIYTKTYDDEKKKLALYFRNDLWNEDESESILINEQFPFTEEILRLRTSSIESSRDHMIQADYESIIGENGQIEVGIRGETRIISADFNAETANGSVYEVIPGFKNILDYFERVGSAYFQYNYKKDALGLQIGLRNEFTHVKVEGAEESIQPISKTYNRLFPSFSLNYQLTQKKSIQLSYSRRIRRPSFWQLNPFRGLSDPTLLFIGDPDMDPAYTDRLELNFVQQPEKLTLNPAIYTSRTLDYFEIARDQQVDNLFGFETGTIIERPINLEQEIQYGVELIGNYRPSKTITFSSEFNYFGYTQRGEFGDRNFDFDFATWSGGLGLQVNFPKDISFQTRISYNGRYKTVQQLEKANSFFSASLSKKWNKRLTLTLNTWGPRWSQAELFRPSFFATYSGRWTGWRARLNVQYRFEKGAGSDRRRERGRIR